MLLVQDTKDTGEPKCAGFEHGMEAQRFDATKKRPDFTTVMLNSAVGTFLATLFVLEVKAANYISKSGNTHPSQLGTKSILVGINQTIAYCALHVVHFRKRFGTGQTLRSYGIFTNLYVRCVVMVESLPEQLPRVILSGLLPLLGEPRCIPRSWEACYQALKSGSIPFVDM